MRKLVTEFIGTFFLVLTIGLSVLHAGALAPFAIGSMLMVMVYMGGHISGAHYNPAVTLAIWLKKKITTPEAGAYVAVQLGGAVAAGLVYKMLTGGTFTPAPGAGVSTVSALIVEILFTFALALVVLNVAVAKGTQGNSFYGAAIGFTVAAGAAAGGAISGGAYNPAVGLGTAAVHAALGSGEVGHAWLYLVGPAIGGALAAFVFGVQTNNEA